MPVRECSPGTKLYRMVCCGDPFGELLETHAQDFELTYTAGAHQDATDSPLPAFRDASVRARHKRAHPVHTEKTARAIRGDRTPDELFAAQIGLWSLKTRILVSP